MGAVGRGSGELATAAVASAAWRVLGGPCWVVRRPPSLPPGAPPPSPQDRKQCGLSCSSASLCARPRWHARRRVSTPVPPPPCIVEPGCVGVGVGVCVGGGGGGGGGRCVCVWGGGGGPLHIDAEDTAPPSSSSGCRQKTNLVLVPPVDVIPAPAGSVAPLYVQHTCGTCATRTSPSAAHVTTVALAECGMMRAWNTCRGSGAGKGQGYAWGRHGFCRSCTTAGVVQASQPR